MENAIERLDPRCPACRCHLLHGPDAPLYLVWARCHCGWRGLARFWRRQS